MKKVAVNKNLVYLIIGLTGIGLFYLWKKQGLGKIQIGNKIGDKK